MLQLLHIDLAGVYWVPSLDGTHGKTASTQRHSPSLLLTLYVSSIIAKLHLLLSDKVKSCVGFTHYTQNLCQTLRWSVLVLFGSNENVFHARHRKNFSSQI